MFSATAGQNIFMFLIKENIVSDVTNKAAFEFVIYFQAKKPACRVSCIIHHAFMMLQPGMSKLNG